MNLFKYCRTVNPVTFANILALKTNIIIMESERITFDRYSGKNLNVKEAKEWLKKYLPKHGNL